MLFAALVLVAYSYWYLTNDDRVRREVETYVARMTRGTVEVEVDSAQFRLFGGVRISGMRVTLPDGSKQAFFEAGEVRLVHKPWSLLLKGKLEVTEIMCVGATVRPVEDLTTGKWNFMQIFPLGGGLGAGGGSIELPEIRLRDTTIIRSGLDRLHEEGAVLEKLSVALLPDPERGVYELTFEGRLRRPEAIAATRPADEDIVRGEGTISLATGETQTTGLVGLAGLDVGLRRRYRQLHEDLKLTGKISWEGVGQVGSLSPSKSPDEIRRLKIGLEDVGMTLPADMGGVRLEQVRGSLVFDRNGIDITELTATVAESGGLRL